MLPVGAAVPIPVDNRDQPGEGFPMDLDLVVTRGMLLDGTGKPRFAGDVGIAGGKIAAVSVPGALSGRQTIDAAGCAVCPGFIDIHSHSDWILPLPDHSTILAPLVAQGVTTIVGGNCGFSPAPVTEASIPLVDSFSAVLRDRAFPYEWRSMADFLDLIERRGLLLNAAFLVGHGTLRYAVMGKAPRAPSPGESNALAELTRQSLREGAFGLSAGLAYDPGVFAREAELLPLLRAVRDGGIFTVHGRAYTWVSPFYRPIILGTPHHIRSARELLGLARKSGTRLQLSHQIFIGRRTWHSFRTVLSDIDRAASDGVDVAFDAFPYTAGNSTVNAIFPEWVLDDFGVRIRDERVLRRLRREFAAFRLLLGFDYSDITLLWGAVPELSTLEGLDFAAIARKMGMSEFDAYIHVARESSGKARILLGTYSGDGEQEEPLRAVLSHPLCAFETDTILTRAGVHNPASFGTFPRVLGRYSRDLGLFRLEEAIRRMTSLPAERIGLTELGRIAPGHWADLVIFDPKAIADNTSFRRPDAPPSGVRTVLISGEVVAQNGSVLTDKRHGRVLRR